MNKYDPTESDTCRTQIAANVAQIERLDNSYGGELLSNPDALIRTQRSNHLID